MLDDDDDGDGATDDGDTKLDKEISHDLSIFNVEQRLKMDDEVNIETGSKYRRNSRSK